MENNEFIPSDTEELYQKLVKDNVKGQLLLDGDWIIWRFSNKIMIKASIIEIPHEGHIETVYLLDEKEISLTHWHSMEDEIYSDLKDINEGDIIWILKKRKLIFKQFPIQISRKTFDVFPDKKRDKYYVLD